MIHKIAAALICSALLLTLPASADARRHHRHHKQPTHHVKRHIHRARNADFEELSETESLEEATGWDASEEAAIVENEESCALAPQFAGC